MGRHPSPATVAARRGTFKPARHFHSGEEHQSPGELGQPPAQMDDDGKRLWSDVQPWLESIGAGRSDRAMLIQACELYSLYRQLKRQSDQLGHNDNRLFYRMLGTWKACDAILSKFALTPFDRTKLKRRAAEAGGANPLAELLTKGLN